MANFFYRIFTFTSHSKLLSSLFLLGIISISVFYITRIRLEENIINIIPHDENTAQVSQVFEGLKMNDRLVMHLYQQDSAVVAPDSLIRVAASLADSLQQTAAPLIDTIISKFPDSQLALMYNYYFDNLPFYLQDSDYIALEKRVTPEGINTTLNKFYRALMSPMGVVTKKMLVKDPFSLTTFPLIRSKDLQLDDNFSLYNNYIVTKDRKHLIFFVELSNPPNETAHNGQLIDKLNRLIGSFEAAYPATRIEYFGSAAIAVANANRMKRDIYLTVSLAMIGLFLFISFFYRNFSTFFIVVLPGAFGAVVAVAILSIVKDTVSVISLAVGSVLLGITIDYALHLFTHAKQEKNRKQLFRDLTVPILMSSLTTSFAFFSLIFIRSTALQDLGIFAGISVLAASLFTLIVLPHFTMSQEHSKQPVASKNAVEKIVSAMAEYPLHRKKWALLLFFIFTLVSVFTWRNFSFESNMLGLNYMPERLSRYEKNINAISTFSANNIYVATTGKDLSTALEANIPLEKGLKALEKQHLIYGYLTLNKMIPAPSVQRQRLQQWNDFWNKQGRDTTLSLLNSKAEQLGFQQHIFQAFDTLLHRDYQRIGQQEIQKILSVFGEDLIIHNPDSSVTVLSSIKLSASEKPLVLQKMEKLPGVLILDKGYMISKLVLLLREDFSKLVNISFILVFLIILLSYGRLELAIIAFLPSVISWLWVLGLMGLLGLTFNIVNVIICTFIFGLGVDYGIFIMRGLIQDYKFGLANLLSYKKSIILSAVTTLTGIGVLAFAQHPALKSIAFLAIIGIISVIFITFTLEQVLYDFLIGNRKRKGVIPFTFVSVLTTLFAFLYFSFGCLLLFLIRIIFLLPVGAKSSRKYRFHWIMMLFCRSLAYIMVHVKKNVIDRELADFGQPSVIICNHHSFIDIPLMLMFHPKVVMVTNDWVYYSPLFGKAVQYADFIPASQGMENQLAKIEKLIEQGYSILIFPEGTRSCSFQLRRFHKGAFYLASHFKLDIQPVILHGTSQVMPKGDDYYLKTNPITIKFLPRIKYDGAGFGTDYHERAKKISRYFKTEYQQVRQEKEIPDFFKEILFKNFIYKGPVLEWYLKIKYKFEDSYRLFHALVPLQGRIVDLGCGYGFISYALGLSSAEREIFGIDYDEHKIQVARQCPVRPDNITLACGDVVNSDYGEADVFILRRCVTLYGNRRTNAGADEYGIPSEQGRTYHYTGWRQCQRGTT